ncbi:transcriptional regulator [Mycobacterium intermedium]|uniref:Transcriptional regulator n=1 Tax=Mycobacterium intermedium TaxID=28445 RepID=A0A1E3SGM0_MYCIE|nr:response regulator transcription factor [Mycobacterium intermedium]MCV6965744.1 response regulator transcription factor [Mycobacterium intermedium]ODR01212.1 transcriptional regulator [Mycobacterium intermedium]OPE50699.1 transcriptional regulator [Mycobacterium intermedium]ORA98348.1 transcriptional regulator [Mycobacterium intermedium]
MEVLLVSNDADFVSGLPTLDSFAQIIRRLPIDAHNLPGGEPDIAIIDARTDLVAARRACRRLTASTPALALVAVVALADYVDADIDWQFDDVLLGAASGVELQTRLRLAITRRRSASQGTLQFGDLVLHPDRYTATRNGVDLGLTLTEFKLLNFLVEHAGRAFSRTRLMREVWGYDSQTRVRTVDVHVRRLRAKLGPDYESMVETVRGVGYMAVTSPQPRWAFTEPPLLADGSVAR